jgi:hypothetical protein
MASASCVPPPQNFDFAEIPSVSEILQMDGDHSKKFSPSSPQLLFSLLHGGSRWEKFADMSGSLGWYNQWKYARHGIGF